MKKIQLAIRDFALPVPRRGSIEMHSGFGPAPMTGQELHAHWQMETMRSHSNYRPEVWISHSLERDEFQFVISGRMDGVFDDLERPRIEEIKTAFNPGDLARKLRENPFHPYCLQLKTYAYFYFKQYGVMPHLTIQIVSMRDRRGTSLDIELNLGEYEPWLELRLQELISEHKAREAAAKKRKKIAAELRFPFEKPRTKQMDLVQAVTQSLEGEDPLLVQAPTGMGKTAGVVYPLLKEALSRGERLLYVTPKNSQHSVAEETIKMFQDDGQAVKFMTIRAKGKLCMKAEPICNPEFCEYAKDHYSKVADNNLVETLAKKKKITYRSLKRLAQTHEICPFELQMEVAEKMDAVICDYNYVFSPRNALARLASEGAPKAKKPNLIIDEAHNLPSRATSYFSPSLSTNALELMRSGFTRLPSPWAEKGLKLLETAIHMVYAYQPTGMTLSAQVVPDSTAFFKHDELIKDYMQEYLESDVTIEPNDPVLKLANYWTNFAEATTFVGDNFFCTYQQSNRGAVLKITCCDASEMLKETYSNFAHVVGFSATLKPFDYYAKLSGMDLSRVKTREFQSPFPKENRKLVVIPQVSTKYASRQANFGKIKDAIERIVAVKPGNYFVFFPSFEFLDQILTRVHLPAFTLLRQHREMTNSQVEDYLAQMKYPEKPILLFAVQGGVFSEGVDYPGEMAIGAIIVGPGLPTFDLERELIRKFYDERYDGEGFNFAYSYPAMAKVVQSAGRVIRSETDRGLIVLMDSRFMSEPFYRSMPGDWFDESPTELVSNEILRDIHDFWGGP